MSRNDAATPEGDGVDRALNDCCTRRRVSWRVTGGWHDRLMNWTAQARSDAASTPLAEEVRRAGYYPELVLGTLDVAVAGEEIVVDLVQAETTFDDAVHRHLTVLALTDSRLIIVHVDDVPREDGRPGAVATSEAVPLSLIHI